MHDKVGVNACNYASGERKKKWKSRREWVGKTWESMERLVLQRKECFFLFFYILLIYYLNCWDENLKNKFQSPNFLQRKPQQNISFTFSFCFFVLSWLMDTPFKKNCFASFFMSDISCAYFDFTITSVGPPEPPLTLVTKHHVNLHSYHCNLN